MVKSPVTWSFYLMTFTHTKLCICLHLMSGHWNVLFIELVLSDIFLSIQSWNYFVQFAVPFLFLVQHFKNEKAKRKMNDVKTLKKERLDEMLSEFLRDFKEDKLTAEGWPTHLSVYTVSKAAVNAYARLLAHEHPWLRVTCVCPGFVKTDINGNNGVCPVEDGARGPVMLALLPDDGPSGLFFAGTEASGF